MRFSTFEIKCEIASPQLQFDFEYIRILNSKKKNAHDAIAMFFFSFSQKNI